MAPRQRHTTSSSEVFEDESSTAPFQTTAASLWGGSKHGRLFNAITRTSRRKQPSTLNQTEADIARDWHDYFNLIALFPIIASTTMNYNWRILVTQLDLQGSWTGNHFWLMWSTTLVYFLIDLIWVARVPICVKSPGVIIKHHLVAMVYLAAPVAFPQYSWFMGSILSVEINTWFLILRRVVFKGVNPPSPLVGTTVSACFYMTWILVRCIVYPAVLLKFFLLAAAKIHETGVYLHLPMLFIPAHAVLCILNLKWTYDLFKPIVKRWLGIGPKPMVLENGL